MSEILPEITVGELQRPADFRRRAECLRQSADACSDDKLRACLLDTAIDLETEARLLEYEAMQFR
jgi:hypothetical protein